MADKLYKEISTDVALDVRNYTQEGSKENIKGDSVMRVLIYTHRFPPSQGGMQTQCLNLARGLHEAGKEVIVLAPSYTSDEKELDRKNGFKVIRIPFIGKVWLPFLKYILGFLYLIAVLLWYDPNIVFFIHKETQIVGGMFPLFPFKYMVRATARPDFLSYSFKEFWLIPVVFIIKRMYSRATRIICHSYTVKEVLERAQISMENVVVIGSGVENKFLSELPRVEVLNKIKDEFGIKKEEKVILTVARIVRRKGHDSVINALSQIVKEFPKIKYLIVGDGDYKGAVVTLVERLGLADNVIFTGEIPHDDILHFYDICDVFVMPNRPIGGKIEGLPNALLEAAARGKPIVAGANFGSLEVVEDGKSGYLVNPDNVDEIRTAILNLLKSEDKALAFGRKGKKRVQNFYTEDIMMNELLRVLEDLNGVPSKDVLGRDFTQPF